MPRLPDLVRVRVLARARVAPIGASESAPPILERARGMRLFLAISAAWIAGAVGAAVGATAVLRGRAAETSALVGRSSFDAVTHSRIHPPAPFKVTSPIHRPPISTTEARRQRRSATTRESYPAEMDLLSRAQAAYVGRDFSGALVLVAEHGRRFSNGRLGEEREALRVRSLADAGRAADARRAAIAFASRFPRSVFLPHLQEDASAAQ